MNTSLQLPDLYKVAAELVAKRKEKNNLTGGDLLPKMVLELNINLGKLAELAGVGEWHRTGAMQGDQPCDRCGGRGFWYEGPIVWCERCERAGRLKPLLKAFAEASVMLYSIGNELGLPSDSCLPSEIGLEDADITFWFDVMFYYLNGIICETDNFGQKRKFRLLADIFNHIGTKIFNFEWDQIATAVLESIKSGLPADPEHQQPRCDV